MLNRILNINLLVIFFASFSFAEIINDIDVIGNKRISKESIIVFGEIKRDVNYNQDDLNNVLKNIYETNFFKKIELNIINKVLVINVVEINR